MGVLQKMAVELQNPVQYHLRVGEEKIPLNPLLGKKIQLRYSGEIFCLQCWRKTNKSFQQGYCFPCYRRLLECNLCSIHPEKCRYYEGQCGADDWAHSHCGQPQMVYLANSSGLKVGITRVAHLYSRWIDQGASQGLPIISAQNRHQVGLIEVLLKKFVADKTNWQAMLKAQPPALDLIALRDDILQQAGAELAVLQQRFPGEIQVQIDATVTELQYPVLEYPQKIKALDFEKNPVVEGILQGIKGQYLLLDMGVISIRKFGGYKIELSV